MKFLLMNSASKSCVYSYNLPLFPHPANCLDFPIQTGLQLSSRKRAFIKKTPRMGGGYSHILAIRVCATVKGMVFKPFSLGSGPVIIENWSRIGSRLRLLFSLKPKEMDKMRLFAIWID